MTGPSLDHLRTFVTVFRTGSLSRAAALLGISQSTASAHVQALEGAVGHALFVRETGGVSATARGAELAREVAAHVDALEDAVVPGAPSAPRPLHVGGAAEILSTLVVPRLPEVVAAVGVPLRFVFGLADDLLDELAARSLDVVVSAVRPRLRGVAAVPAYDEEFVLVAAPAWAGRALEETPLVAYAENLPIVRRYWRSVFERRPDSVDVVAVIPDLRGIRAAVLAGLGMSVLPRYLVETDLADGGLVALHTPAEAPLNTLYVATRAGEAERSAHLGALVAELRRLLR